MSMQKFIRLLPFLITIISCALGQNNHDWNFDGGITISHFQQQVKSEVGGERGQRLINQTEFGILIMGTYRVWQDYIHGGIFLQYDSGNREAAGFAGFDPVTGRTVTENKLGGKYDEFWLGPFLRGQWRNLFIETGWAVIGQRNDDGRSDLATAQGDSTGTLDLLPTVAFFGAIGASVPLQKTLDLIIRIEYRGRYYKGREGKAFINDIKHGTQNITPFFGLRWKL